LASRNRNSRGNDAMNRMKYEIANEVGVNLKKGYNGDITSREAGKVGGNMVKKMINYAKENMPGGNQT